MIYFRMVLERVTHLFEIEYLTTRKVAANNDKINLALDLIKQLKTIAGLSDENEAFKQISPIFTNLIADSKTHRTTKPSGKYERFLIRSAAVIKDALTLSDQCNLRNISEQDLLEKNPVTILMLILAQYLTDRCYDKKRRETPAGHLFNIDTFQSVNTVIDLAGSATSAISDITSNAAHMARSLFSSSTSAPIISEIASIQKPADMGTPPSNPAVTEAEQKLAEKKTAEIKAQQENQKLQQAQELLAKQKLEAKEQAEKQKFVAEFQLMFPKDFPDVSDEEQYNETLDSIIIEHLTLLPAILAAMRTGKPTEKAVAHSHFNLILADVEKRLPVYISRVKKTIDSSRKLAQTDLSAYLAAARATATSVTLHIEATALDEDARQRRNLNRFYAEQLSLGNLKPAQASTSLMLAQFAASRSPATKVLEPTPPTVSMTTSNFRARS